MSKYLVIVESPAKSKTIEKYLGSEYTVTSSKGHIRDLSTTGFGGFGVDIENNFKPKYKIMRDKRPVIKELKNLVKKAEKVYLATDPDREGEAISWHLYDVLGLNDDIYERIVFHEITKPAILYALEHGRKIDQNLVHSQESRRILDRIIGFSLSKLLQKKIGSKSAGRVQSVALKLIVDREKEIQAFVPEEYWEVFIEFTKDHQKIKAKLTNDLNGKISLKNNKEVKQVVSKLIADYKVYDIQTKTSLKNPRPPYITSTLQQDASSKFNFTSKKTMTIAQRLYEGIELGDERVGLITYMRTDSTRLSSEFIVSGKNYILENYGEQYYAGYNQIASKNKNVQDAHEAIRPSNLKYTPESIKKYLSNDEYKLYSLIYYRAISALMKPAEFLDTKLVIENNNYFFEVNGKREVFDGYLKAYGEYEKESYQTLPPFELGEVIKNVKVLEEQKFTSPPSRYSEARLIRQLEELGIGRPSTYAVIIDTLKQRRYVKMEKKMFVPTEQGILTSEKLEEFFSSIINVKYTAQMEERLDLISEGKVIWYEELREFYDKFMPLLEFANQNMEKIYPRILDETCPECGLPLVVRHGRYGEFIACSGFPKCRYTRKEKKEEITTGITCPVCHIGEIVERVSSRGRSKGQKFYACNRYPKCKTTFSHIPTEDDIAKLDNERLAKDA